jgi:hypothetical protein
VSYITLGSRQQVAEPDASGLNPGNFTSLFAQADFDINLAYYEIYSITVTGLVVVGTATVYVNTAVRSTSLLFGNSEWDPSQPILLKDGDQVALAWDFGAGQAPLTTLWLRYDPDLNKGL